MSPTKMSGKSTIKSTDVTIPQLEHINAAALGMLASLHSRRAYNGAIEKFAGWYCSEPRLGFNRAVGAAISLGPRITLIVSCYD